MEEPQPSIQPRRSMSAVLSALFALLSVGVLFFFPDEGLTAYYMLTALVLAVIALVLAGIAISHFRHDPTMGGRIYAYVGFGLSLAEILFAAWAVGAAL